MKGSVRECAHLRGGIQFLRDNRDSLPRGMVKQMVDMYSLARDQDGHRVLDGRQWRGYR